MQVRAVQSNTVQYITVYNSAVKYNKNNNKSIQLIISATIRIGWEIQCLLYAGFFLYACGVLENLATHSSLNICANALQWFFTHVVLGGFFR